MKKKLLSYKYKFITVDELIKMAGDVDYMEFAGIVEDLVDKNLLSPSGRAMNGRRPSLYNKYRINKPVKDYSKALEDIKLLHPSFNHSKYAANPQAYLKHKEEIDKLSRFLWENRDSLKEPVSVNERSFQIWGKEKLIKDTSVVRSIFNFNDWDLSLLNFYETPEPFFEYIFSNSENMNILIIENKDTWFTLRKIMQEEGLNCLFREYNVLLYGEGKKIIRSSSRLLEYDSMQKGSLNHYYYFGDLDYEGIDIYQTLFNSNENLEISLATELYTWMIDEAYKFNLPESKEGQKKIQIDMFLSYFDEKYVQMIIDILDKGLYIPQEILNYSKLKEKMLTEQNAKG